jgi:hypothetical protein
VVLEKKHLIAAARIWRLKNQVAFYIFLAVARKQQRFSEDNLQKGCLWRSSYKKPRKPTGLPGP